MKEPNDGPNNMTEEQKKLYKEIIGEAKELDLAFRSLLGRSNAPANPPAAMALVGIATNIWQLHHLNIDFLIEFMKDYHDWMVCASIDGDFAPGKFTKGN